MYSHKSPTRIDLSGGTLDLWPIWALIKNCVTINVAIDVYTQASIEPLEGLAIEIVSKDYKTHLKFDDLSQLLTSKEPSVALVKAHIDYWHPQQGFRLTTQSESPVGGGLGGSSSLSVSLFSAFEKWLSPNKLKNSLQVAKACSNIEARILNTPTGLQDYYPAINGGVNEIAFTDNGEKIFVAEIPEAIKKSHFLVYTGRSHHSGMNNWQVYKSLIEGDATTLKGLESLRDISLSLSDMLKKKDWQGLSDIYQKEYVARIGLCEAFSSPEIIEIQKIAKSESGDVKICGAGGGGCVLVYAPQNNEKIRAQISKSFKVMDMSFVSPLKYREIGGEHAV